MTCKIQRSLFVLLAGLLLANLSASSRIYADETRGKPNVKAWKNDRAEGQKAIEKKQFPKAVASFKAALEEARNFGAKDDRLADSLTDLAHALWAVKDYTASEPLFREAAQIRHGDPDSMLEADAVYDLALNCAVLGHYDEAAQAFQRAEVLLTRKFGANYPEVVRLIFERGKIYFRQGDYAQAEPLLKRTVVMLEHPVTEIVARDTGTQQSLKNFYRRRYAPDYFHALEGYSFLSAIYIQQNRLPQAEDCLKNSLRIVDENADKGDPLLADVLHELSRYYTATTNYAAAEPLFQRLIKLDEKNHGATNELTLKAKDELARVYEQDKKYPEAESLFQDIFTVSDATAGPDSRDSAVALANLAKFYVDRENYEKAEPLYRRLATHAEKFGGGLDLTPVLADQVIIYSKLGKDAELEAVYKQQIVVFEKMLGSNTPALVKPLNDCAALLRKNKHDAEADPLAARALAIQAAQHK